MLEILFFLYSISMLLVIRAFMVIFSNNVVYSLLYLMLCFLSASFLLFLFECEFLALIFMLLFMLGLPLYCSYFWFWVAYMPGTKLDLFKKMTV